jgi:tRNA modification GTPase
LQGPPNVGKSSLLNALAGESAAIVSEVAGTTRDYVTRGIVIDGLACRLIDTAGLGAATTRESSPGALAEQASRAIAEQAHVVLRCEEVASPSETMDDDSRTIRVLTKADACPRHMTFPPATIVTSSLLGEGLDRLRLRIAKLLRRFPTGDTHVVSCTADRCRDSLRMAAACVARARAIVAERAGEELVAAELRLALEELGRVAGVVYTDDVLDRIFSRFCIGK